MHCGTCAKALDVDVDQETGSLPHEHIQGGARCECCLEPMCGACLLDGWCRDCTALSEKLALFPSLSGVV
jgi:hypothetical protein